MPLNNKILEFALSLADAAEAQIMNGDKFRIEIVDARKPEEVHKSLEFNSDSLLIRQIRSDFSYPQTIVVIDAH